MENAALPFPKESGMPFNVFIITNYVFPCIPSVAMHSQLMVQREDYPHTAANRRAVISHNAN